MYLKYLLIILFFSSLLFSKGEDVSVDTIDTIEKLLNKNEYKNSCELVDVFYKNNPYDFKANLYYGKCAYYRGDIDGAMAAYDRADIINEEDSSVHKHLGDLHAYIGNIEIANEEYDKADKFGNEVVERSTITGHKTNTFSLLARFSVGVDDNVKYNADISDMNEWFSITNYPTQPESDTFIKEYVRLTHTYDSNPFSSFYYKNQLHIYNKNYSKFDTEDFTQGEFYSGPGWASSDFDIWLPVSYTYMAISYEDYAEVFSFKPQVRKRFANKVLLKIEAEYQYQKYFNWDYGDKDIYFASLSLSRWFGKNYLRAAYHYTKVEKHSSDSPRIFIEKNINELEVNYTRRVTKSIEFGIGYLYATSLYKDAAKFLSEQRREDTLQKYSAYVSYNITNNIGVMMQYADYDNETNYIPSDYAKEVITAGLYLYY
ncbi:hypothetical protein HUE87_01235 [Candidatus Sulfurimonas marisnigri]|uniref:Tetratricopeptide repeat protein n=1 Tax=Candidatus Sulfurimonas marisnigri TaxID=2740405 RepID=A0A7S7M0N7_9BACT|nr:hypothetical protein [Candidatus Sulfurimonas marisnigri]QOY54901.1 hypothetical protein HUE87_01235 [Candidatus Sulfurimonas marisnigri]